MSTDEMDRVVARVRSVTEASIRKTAVLEEEFGAVAQGGDYSALRDVLLQYMREAETWQGYLRDVLVKVSEQENLQLKSEQYGERWWQRKRQALTDAFQRDDQQGLYLWMQTFATALLNWELTTCQKLVDEPFIPGEAILKLFRSGVQALQNEQYPQALDMLRYLVEITPENSSPSALDEISQAMLLVFMGRIYLYKLSENDAALMLFERAKKVAPDDGCPYGVLGSYYQALENSSQALELYKKAIELSPGKPDGYIGMGLLSEEEESWDEADGWFREAIGKVREEKDALVALSKLLSPSSGNLYLHLARTLKDEAPERALQAVEWALKEGIRYSGQYPNRMAYQLKGEILEILERPIEAAEAHYRAGECFEWQGDFKTADELLKHANELNPRNALICWERSEVLRLLCSQKTPPYVDKKTIKLSKTCWEQGDQLKAPGDANSRVYAMRAMINERLRLLPEFAQKQSSLCWEGVAYLEFAHLLDGKNSFDWASLAFHYRLLEVYVCALYASAKAIEYDSEYVYALDERVAALADVGDYQGCEKVIEKRLKVEASAWVNGVKAYVLLRKKNYQDALLLLQEVVKNEPEDIWSRSQLAQCYQLLNEQQNARKEYEWIWEYYCRYRDQDYLSRISFAWAAYWLDKVDEAIEILRSMIDGSYEVVDTLWSLGLFYLTKGDEQIGEDYVDKAIELINTVKMLDNLLEIDLYFVETFSSRWLRITLDHNVLARIKEKVHTKKRSIEREPTVEGELKRIIRENPLAEDTISWPWVGAQASLGRYYCEQERWEEAVKIYLALHRAGERFTEVLSSFNALLALEKAADGLCAKGDEYLKASKPDEAIECYQQLHTLKLSPAFRSESEHKTWWAQLSSRLGYAYFDLAFAIFTRTGNPEDSRSFYFYARYHFIEAVKLYREGGSSSPGEALSEVCRLLPGNVRRNWSIDILWKLIEEQPGIDVMLRGDIITARESLRRYLDEFYKLSERNIDTSKLSPIHVPIRLEIGKGLIAEDTSVEDWVLFTRYIPEMKQRILDELGVNLPGVRVRENKSLSSGGYNFLLDEAQVAYGSVYLDMRYCPVASEALRSLGIAEDALVDTPHPVMGEPGCWVQREFWDVVLQHELELWEEPLLFVIYHLGAVLRTNLTKFVGVQEVEILLAEWERSEEAASLITAALPDDDTRFRFVQVLRALVREQVPIVSWKDILETIRDVGLADGKVRQAVHAIRQRLRSSGVATNEQ